MSKFGTTEFDYRVALGEVPGYTTWNKFGYNPDIPIGTEVVAVFGGTYEPLAAAETLSFVSTDAADAAAGTGAESVVVTGVGAGYTSVVEVVTLTGITPVITTNAFLAVNRVSVFLSGTSNNNVGTITATSTGSATIEAQLPAGQGTTQQCMFTTKSDSQLLMRSLFIDGTRLGGGTDPVLTVIGKVYSDVSGSQYEVFRGVLDTSVQCYMTFEQNIPFVVGPSSTIWFEVTSDKVGANVNLRFSFVEVMG